VYYTLDLFVLATNEKCYIFWPLYKGNLNWGFSFRCNFNPDLNRSLAIMISKVAVVQFKWGFTVQVIIITVVCVTCSIYNALCMLVIFLIWLCIFLCFSIKYYSPQTVGKGAACHHWVISVVNFIIIAFMFLLMHTTCISVMLSLLSNKYELYI
jgi:hypothetical protein